MGQHEVIKRGAILLLGGLLDMQMTAAARGGFATEHPFAAEHIDALPADIRREVAKREGACGKKASAAHYFAVSIEAGGQRFVSLHFEEFACPNLAAVCDASGCIHEVYAESRGRYRLVFRQMARDVKLTNDEGVAGMEVVYDSSRVSLRWTGRDFVPAGTVRNRR